MLRIWIFMLTFFLSVSSSAEAYTTASPTDFIYKAGILSTKINLVFLQPYTKNFEINGASVSIGIKGKKVLRSANTKSDTSQIFTISLKDLLVSTQQKNSVRFTSANISRDTAKNIFTWNLEVLIGGTPFKSQMLFTKEEYPLIAVEEEVYAKPGGGGLLIQYVGTDPDSSDLIFYLTNEAALPHFSVKKIRKNDVPGYFKFLDGIIQIRSIKKDGDAAILEYEWEKAPKPAQAK